jgi:AcrR family transcriptional regulator
MRCIDLYGPHKTGLSDVAAELGITRQTVYRLYPSTDDLLIAVGVAAAGDYLDRLAAHLANFSSTDDVVVEAIAYTYEQLPNERFLGLLLTTGRPQTFLKAVASPEAMTFGRLMLTQLQLDWGGRRPDDDELDELVEFGLRILQSLVLDPPTSRTPEQLRSFLRHCVAPAFGAAPTQRGQRTRGKP